MKFELEEFHQGVSIEELIADLKRVATELDQNFVTTRQQDRNGKYNSSTFKRRFGSWVKALESAGLSKTEHINEKVSTESLFQNLEEVWTKLGRQPRSTEMFAPMSKYSASAYARSFGGWRKALESFVTYINKEKHMSSAQGIKSIEIEPITRHKTQRSVNSRLRFVVMQRDNFKCKNCGRSPATRQNTVLHVDHIIPWAKGGETILENLQTLCSKCNIGKGDLE